MAVINVGSPGLNTTHDKCTCTFCGKVAHPPYVYWNLGSNVETWICADCCVGLRKGLMQDMIQVAASEEIKRATGERLYMVRAKFDELTSSGQNASHIKVVK